MFSNNYWCQVTSLAGMTSDGVDVQLVFPNVFKDTSFMLACTGPVENSGSSSCN